MSFRTKGIDSLSKVLTIEKNIKTIEELLFKVSKEHVDLNSDKNIEDIYKEYIYQVIGDICSKKFTMKIIAQNIKDNKLNFDHHSFDDIRSKQKEQDDYLVCPFDVQEGVMQCNKCDSKKVISYSKQTRGGDESTTVFCTCVNPKCGFKWTC